MSRKRQSNKINTVSERVEEFQPKRSQRISYSDDEDSDDEEQTANMNFDGEWSTGICGCCQDCKICCCAFLCAPFFVCYLFNKADELCCTPYICPMSFVALRTKVRVVYKIDGELWKDYCTSIFCGWCAMVQMANEMQNQGIEFC